MLYTFYVTSFIYLSKKSLLLAGSREGGREDYNGFYLSGSNMGGDGEHSGAGAWQFVNTLLQNKFLGVVQDMFFFNFQGCWPEPRGVDYMIRGYNHLTVGFVYKNLKWPKICIKLQLTSTHIIKKDMWQFSKIKVNVHHAYCTPTLSSMCQLCQVSN